MNIACTACSARYGVADEKLIGKRVKITCKRCGTVLIVDGNVSPPSVSASTSVAPGPASGKTSSNRAPKASPPPERPPEPPFIVAFSQDRQEEADVAQIVRLHRAGQLTPQTLVWREGMANWVNPWDVEEIAAAFRKMGYARPTPAPAPRPRDDEETTHVADSGPMQSALFDDDEATQIVDSSRYNEQPLPSFGSSPASSHVSEDDEVATHVARSPSDSPGRATQKQRDSNRAQRRESTRAARRESTRPAAREQAEPARRQRTQRGGQDLFANQAHAGSEAEAIAIASAMADAVDEPRLTGARNENSVLFSLDALMQKELRSGSPAAPPQRSHRMEEALLVDMSGSLPGGGGIAPALAAPDFTAPITAPPPRFAPADVPSDDELMPPPRRSKVGLVFLLLLAFVGIGGVGFAMGTGKLQPLLVKVGLAPPPAASEQVEAKPAASASAAAAPEGPSASAEPVASASAAPGASASPGSEKPAAPPTGTATAAPPPTGVAAASPPPATAPGGGGTPRAKAADTPAKEEPPTQTGFGAGTPFDAQAAKTALGGAAANASSCKEPGGPTGTGRVSITFAASGRPTSVAVTGDLAGTTVGSCVARLFRSARVPAFSGEPVTVSKTFSVQ
jgi:predicted Zn finger-like uncharacterized protein